LAPPAWSPLPSELMGSWRLYWMLFITRIMLTKEKDFQRTLALQHHEEGQCRCVWILHVVNAKTLLRNARFRGAVCIQCTANNIRHYPALVCFRA
jgi:hypothetical protein